LDPKAGNLIPNIPKRFLEWTKNFLYFQVVAVPNPFVYEIFGLTIRRGTPPPMLRIHSHTAVELIIVTRGSLVYRFAGEKVEFIPGNLYVFSGLTPHELEEVVDQAYFVCMTVPLAAFIRWRLPENINAPILRGEILSDSAGDHESLLFDRWWDDIEGGDPRRVRITLPEVQAHMERMALSPALTTAWRRSDKQMGKGGTGTLLRVERMLQTIAARFAESLDLEDLANGTDWHPRYAAGQFKQWIGVSPGEFLLQQRVAHAKHLLAVGDAKVIDVAEECGFASQSSFYAAFTRLTGTSPAAYRRGGRG